MSVVNALTIDLEEWYHSELVEGKRSSLSRVAEATQPILDLLDQHHAKATFFVVGEVAEQNPELIRSIFQRGHEIGCHGYSHRLLSKLDEGLFREEMEQFHSLIKRIVGEIKVKGFRAPCFSLDNRTKWALKVLLDFGYQYDSSIFPVKLSPLYGVSGALAHPYRISLEDLRKEDLQSPLIEFPISLLTFGKLRIPIAGGGYFRMYPLPLLYWGLRRLSRHRSFLIYYHPWEGDPKTPRVRLSFSNRIRSYYGVPAALEKLEFLLKHFKFTRVDHILGLR